MVLVFILRNLLESLRSVSLSGIGVTWNDNYHTVGLAEVGWGGLKLLLLGGRPVLGIEWDGWIRVWVGPYYRVWRWE